MKVGVSDVVRAVVVDHDPLVECVKFEAAILPFLLLFTQVRGEEAAKFENWSGILGEGNARPGELARRHCRFLYGRLSRWNPRISSFGIIFDLSG